MEAQLERLRREVAARVAAGGQEAHQVAAGELAWAYARAVAARAAAEWAEATGDQLARRISDAAQAEAEAALAGGDVRSRIAFGERLAAIFQDRRPLEDLGASSAEVRLRRTYREFADRAVRPVAQRIHREVLDIPDEIIEGAAALGLFGLSVPREYGGSQEGEHPDHRRMLIATEELSRGSLNAAGSLITRPEILVRALLRAGTEEQKRRWLPDIASGRKMVAVAVTEPGAGSDVAALHECRAERRGGGWVLNGRKRWAGFSAGAELIAVLARTRPGAGHRGLSMFVAEKPRIRGRDFEWKQPGGGRVYGHAIPALGYRGMHTYDLYFEDFQLDGQALIGGEEWLDRGFYLQMESFAVGRLRTSARGGGVMRAAFDDACGYAQARSVFGRPVTGYQLPQSMLGGVLVHLNVSRQLGFHAAAALSEGPVRPGSGALPPGQMEASLAKLYACRHAEMAARDCMQLWGANGYSEESPAARHFLDARVLTIFEGAEEVLALRVIARSLLEAGGPGGEAG